MLCGGCAGDWDAAGKRDAARPAAAEDEEEDEDAFGDFEDLETGQPMPCAAKASGHHLCWVTCFIFNEQHLAPICMTKRFRQVSFLHTRS